MAIKARYKGDGTEYHVGVPARDLTDEDWETLDEEQRDLVLASRLYAVSGVSADRDRERAAERIARRQEHEAPARPAGEEK